MKAETRLNAAVARFGGELEHVVVGISPADYGLPFDVVKEKVRKGLADRGFVFGAQLPHAFRGRKTLREGLHMHVMGSFAEGAGYDRCRLCRQLFCSTCDGFEGLTRRLKKTDGLMVKVLEKRKTIGGTLGYELNHASVLKGVSRFHVLTYFGKCSYNNMGHVEDKKLCCPICGLPLERHNYIGVLPLSAFKRKGKIEDRMFDAEEDGKEVFIPRSRGCEASGVVKPNPHNVEEGGGG
jgi:hypothetical protein